MKLIVVTGVSRGIGLALKDTLAERGEFVIGVSRNNVSGVASNYQHIAADLSNEVGCYKLIEKVDQALLKHSFSELFLINNAGTLGDINPAAELDNHKVYTSIALNLSAPIFLQNSILRLSINNNLPLEVINISSGAATKPYYGWEVYCASKAGLLMASQVFAKEIDELKLNAKIWSLSPGVVDTAMQEQIRNSSNSSFTQKQRFVDLKTEGKLLSPQFVAQFIANALGNSEFLNGGVYDIRDFLS